MVVNKSQVLRWSNIDPLGTDIRCQDDVYQILTYAGGWKKRIKNDMSLNVDQYTERVKYF